MAELAQLPGEHDLSIYRGDDVNFQPTLVDEDQAPLVLPTTGWRAQVRADTDPTSEVLFTIASVGATGTGPKARPVRTSACRRWISMGPIVWVEACSVVD